MHLLYFAVFWGFLSHRCCKTVANFQEGPNHCAAVGTKIFRGLGLILLLLGASDGKFSEGAADWWYALFLCAGTQCVSDLLGGFGLSGTPVIVGVDLQRHIHGAMSGQILDFLHIQSGLEQTGNVGVPQDMC